MMKTVYLLVIILAVQKHGHCLYVCGDLTLYDNKTHDCVNGTLILRGSDDSQLTTPSSPKFLSCGEPPIRYDPEFEDCENFNVIRLETKGPMSEINNSGVTTTEGNADGDIQRINCRTDDFLNCNARVYCGRLDGYQCCGFHIYHPDNRTCCQMSSVEYRIHNVPASQSICCDLEVHSRSSGNVPCQHPAANNKFFGPVKRLKPANLTYDSNMCLNIKYAHKIRFAKQPESTNQLYLRSFVTRYDLNFADQKNSKLIKSNNKIFVRKNIALDNYRPLRKTDIKDFVVLGAHDYMGDTVFYLRPGDMLFRAPKKNMLEKFLKKIIRRSTNCRRFNTSQLRGKNMNNS